MILFAILCVILIILIVAIIIGVGTIGSAAILLFGDVIVCIVFIVLIMKWLIERKNKD